VYLLWGGRFSRHAEGLFPFLAGFVVALRLSRPCEVPLWRFGCALLGANLALFLYFRIADLALWGIGLLLRFHASTRRGIVWVRRAVACFVICGWVALALFGVEAPFARMLAVVLAFPAAVTVVRRCQRGCARWRDGYFQWVATRDPAGKVFRFFRALQTGGVFVVLYGGYEAYLGSFRFDNFTALFLFLQGVLLAHAFPRFGTMLLAGAWGALFSTLPWRFVTHFWPVVVLMGGGLVWQAIRRHDLEPIAGVRASWRGALAIGGGMSLVALCLSGVLFFSLPSLSLSAAGVARWQRVREALQGGEEKPYALVFGAANGRYLTGTPHLAGLLDIVRPEAGATERLHWKFLRHGRLVGKALSAVRTRKEPEEIARLERSAAIISRTFERIAPLIAPGKNERAIAQAVLTEVLAQQGEGLSFPSIIASGRNAAFPHYMKNDAVMRDHLVVIDIGAMYQGYASDMTRTFPVSGTFSEREREIYEIVRN
ncbi:MAG: M24 family metallopeptidase, partial [Deltaproteobacteria bacterium]